MTTSTPESKLSNRQRIFAELVVSGDPATVAYGKAGYSTKGRNAEGNAFALMENHGVKAYIAELREAAATAAGMTRDEAISMLAKIINSKPSEASMENPLCDLRTSKAGPYAAFPDKLRCLARLAKMLGWDGPEKFETTTEVRIFIGGNA